MVFCGLIECWSETDNQRFYAHFAWTLFLAIVNTDKSIPTFIEQSRIKRIPIGPDAESVSVDMMMA